MPPLGLDLGRFVYIAYWTELKLVVEKAMIEDGFLVERRGVGIIGWNAVQMR